MLTISGHVPCDTCVSFYTRVIYVIGMIHFAHVRLSCLKVYQHLQIPPIFNILWCHFSQVCLAVMISGKSSRTIWCHTKWPIPVGDALIYLAFVKILNCSLLKDNRILPGLRWNSWNCPCIHIAKKTMCGVDGNQQNYCETTKRKRHGVSFVKI